MTSKQKLLFIGAHPDDAEFSAGGLIVGWVSAGHEVSILCLTNGAAGHQIISGRALAELRRKEAHASAALLHADVEIWDTADGELEPSIALRHNLIRSIRQYAPDLIVTHRPADYHPDHRATAQLVQDATYLLQVPNIVADTPPLKNLPPILFCSDRFSYPRPFRADWTIDTSSNIAGVVELLHCHQSQVYEWLPYTQGLAVPHENRRHWLRQWYASKPKNVAKRYAAGKTAYAEAFEISEYGGRFDNSTIEFIKTINN